MSTSARQVLRQSSSFRSSDSSTTKSPNVSSKQLADSKQSSNKDIKGDSKKNDSKKQDDKSLQLQSRKSMEVKRVDDKTPERIYNLLDVENITLDIAKKVRETIKHATKQWLFKFLDLGGLQSITFQLVKVQGLSEKTPDEIRTQFELLLSVKAIMNNQIGLDMLIDQPDLVASVALNIDSEDTSICVQVIQ
jgi:hypothetical protein